jgi:hypothetical protein
MTLKKYLWNHGFRISGFHRSKIAKNFNTNGIFNKVPEGKGFVNDYPIDYLESSEIIKIITDYLIEYSNSKIKD